MSLNKGLRKRLQPRGHDYLKQSVRNGQGAQIVRSLRQIGQRSEGCEMSFQVGKAFHLKLYRKSRILSEN